MCFPRRFALNLFPYEMTNFKDTVSGDGEEPMKDRDALQDMGRGSQGWLCD